MVRSRIAQVAYRSVYVILLIVGAIGSMGAFAGSFDSDFYLLYSNQTNFICLVIVGIDLGYGICALAKRRFKGLGSPVNQLRFLALTWLLTSAILYNGYVSGDIGNIGYWRDVYSCIFNLFSPLLLLVDFILFTERKKVCRWMIPCALIYPYAYIAFVYIRANLLGSSYSGIIYPYEFMDPDVAGVGNVVSYVLAATTVVILAALILYGINHLGAIQGKRREKDLHEAVKAENVSTATGSEALTSDGSVQVQLPAAADGGTVGSAATAEDAAATETPGSGAGATDDRSVPRSDFHLPIADIFYRYKPKKPKVQKGEEDFSAEPVLKRVIPFMQSMDQAFRYEPTSDPQSKAWIDGIHLAYRQLIKALEELDIKEVDPAPGEPFNPYVMEGMGTVVAQEPDLVAEVLMRGFTLHGKLIKPASVTVTVTAKTAKKLSRKRKESEE